MPDPRAEQQRRDTLQRIFHVVHARLAPDMPADHYLAAIKEFERVIHGGIGLTDHGERIFSPEEAAAMPDNSAMYDDVAYRYAGLEAARERIAAGHPVAFVVWHHGARRHADYALARVIPETAFFTLRTFQYGRVFSYPMVGNPGLSLVRMNRFLRDRRPVYYYLDGAPLGETAQLPMLGINANIAIAPLRVIASVPGAQIVPVTSYYGEENSVETFFHAPLVHPEGRADASPSDIASALLSLFEADQRERGPAQVLLPFLQHREIVARETSKQRDIRRRELL